MSHIRLLARGRCHFLESEVLTGVLGLSFLVVVLIAVADLFLVVVVFVVAAPFLVVVLVAVVAHFLIVHLVKLVVTDL
jgi:hypothetical protein